MRQVKLTAMILLAVLSGCARRVAKPAPEASATEIVNRLDAIEARVRRVKSDARLKVSSPDGSGTVTMFVAVQAPASLHMESLNFFGQPEAVLVSDGERFGLFQIPQGKYYRGAATAQNLAMFLPVGLAPRELAMMLLGSCPRLESPEQTTASVEGEHQILTLQRGDEKQVIRIDPETGRAVKSNVTGPQAFEVIFEDFDDSTGVAFPKRIRLSVPAAKTTLDLRYQELALDPPEEPALFELGAPARVEVIEVGG